MALRITNSALSVLCVFAALSPTIAGTDNPATLDIHSPQYQSCIREISISPQSAYESASNWQKQSGEAAARHCEALALIELGLNKQGAKMLTDMAASEASGDAHLRATLYAQAGNALMLADNSSGALQSFTAALALDPLKPWVRSDLYVDRGRANAHWENLQEAEDDFSNALEILPHHIEAIVLRAGVRRRQDDPWGALRDLEFALADDPENPDALVERGLLRKKMYDPVGAREDFDAVIALAPNSAAAAIARNGLNKLNIRGSDTNQP